MMASGALEDVVSGPRDDIQLELDRMGASTSVDHELEQMKAELGGGSAPREIEGGQGQADAQPRTATATPAVEQPQAGDPQ